MKSSETAWSGGLPGPVRFPPFTFLPRTGELFESGRPVKLRPQPARVLRLLVARSGEVVTRQEIQKALWDEDTHVDFDVGLNTCIRQIRSALRDDPESSRFIATVPRVGYRFVASLEKDGAIDPKRRVPRSRVTAVAAALLTVSVALVSARMLISPEGAALRPVEARRTVAVLGFRDLSSGQDSSWLSLALSEMLTTELAASEKLRVIPGESIARMKSDLSLPPADSFAADTLRRIRATTGADMVVLGSYTVVGTETERRVRFDVQLQDTEVGDTVGSFTETGTETELFPLVTVVGKRLRSELALGVRSDTEAAAVEASLPRSTSAARAYALGLEKLRLYDYLGARDQLETAIAIEPEFPLAHSALAEIWYRLEYEGKAVIEARTAFELSEKLSREERLLVEARYREYRLERERAIDLYKTLRGFFPDNVEYGLKLARIERDGYDRQDDVHETIAALKRIPGSENDPRIGIAEVRALYWGSLREEERGEALAILGRSISQARATGAKAIEAQAHLVSAELITELPQALAAYERARTLFDEVGDTLGAVRALQWSARRLRQTGQVDRARTVLKQAMKVARGAGTMPTVGEVLGALSTVEISKGELDRAVHYQRQALDIFREVDARSWIPRVELDYGHLLRLRGRLEEAADAFTESLEICRTMSQGPCVYEALAALALVRTHEDKLVQAESLLEEALAHTTKINYLRAVGECHGRLSIVLTEMGRFAEAEISARKAMDFYKDHFGDRNTYGELALAITLARQKRRAEGQEVSDALVEALHDWRRDLPWSLEVVLKAEILSAWFHHDTVALRALRQRADNHGLVHVSLDARLAEADLERDLAKLEAIQRDASAHQYPLLARKAAEAASSW